MLRKINYTKQTLTDKAKEKKFETELRKRLR